MTAGDELDAVLEATGVESARPSLTLAVRVQVVWVNASASNSGSHLPLGMALRFVSMADTDQVQLQGFIQELHSPRRETIDIDGMIDDALELVSEDGDDFDIDEEYDVVELDAEANGQHAQEILTAGTQLGPYTVRDLLGTGGMGNVYLAEHTQLHRQVALKRLHAQFAIDQNMVKRFFDEALVVNQIHHNNIVEITDFISEGSDKFFVMEFLEGESLAHLCDQKAPLTVARTLHIASQLCGALAAVHAAGVIHRDLKPANVMLVERNGDPDFVKLLDFGIAKLRDEATGQSVHKTATGMFLGTPGYMAPEQLLEGDVDYRCDIYAFGVLLYVMVAGRNPFVADTWGKMMLRQLTDRPAKPSTIRGGSLKIPDALESLILACLEKNPEDRPASMANVAATLRRIEAQLTDPWARLLGRSRHFVRSALSIVVLLPILLIATAGGIWWLGVDSITTRFEKLLAPESTPVAKDAPATEVGNSSIPTPPAGQTGNQGKSNAAVSLSPTKSSSPNSDVDSPSDENNGGRGELPSKRRAGRQRPNSGKPTRKTTAAAPTQPGAPPPAVTEAPPPTATLSEAESLYQKGLAHLAQNKALFAISELQKCIKLEPRHAKAHRALGRAHVLLGREKEAVQAFRVYLQLAPTASDAPKLRRIIGDYERRETK